MLGKVAVVAGATRGAGHCVHIALAAGFCILYTAFGSAGSLVAVCFGLFTGWGGARTAFATLAAGPWGCTRGRFT
ncbi:MAG: hypothetical protein ACREL9_00620 [Gemmatimonadales bacterium]